MDDDVKAEERALDEKLQAFDKKMRDRTKILNDQLAEHKQREASIVEREQVL